MALGSLVVRIGLESAEFTSGLSRSEYQAKKFVENVTTTVTRLTVGFTALAGGALATLAALDKAAGTIAVYKGLSEQMGASAEAVAGLQAAADLSGVSLDNVSTASIRLTSSLAQQGEAGKRTAAALAAINIPIKEFKALDPVQQLERVSAELAKFEDGAGKTAVAVELFGRAGAQIIPFLNDLAAAGGRNATLTNEQIVAADNFTKALASLRTEAADLGRAITAELVPPAQKFLDTIKQIRESNFLGFILSSGKQEQNATAEIEKITATIAKLRIERDKLDPSKGFANKLNDLIFGDVGDIDRQIGLLEKQRAYLEKVQAANFAGNALPGPAGAPGKTIDTSGFGGGGAAAKVSEAQRYLETLQKQFEATQNLTVYEQLLADVQAKRLDGLTPKLLEQLQLTARQIDAAKALLIEKEKEEALQSLIGAALQRDVERQEKDNQALRDKAEAYKDLADPMREFLRKLEEIDALVAKGYISADMAGPIKQAIGEAEKPLADMNEYARNAAQGIQSAFADFLFDPFKDGLDGLAENFAKVVQRMIAEAAAAKLVESLFGADFTKTGNVGGLLGGLFGGARAIGGPVSSGMPYLVGERGPELFVPNGSGRIVPNDQVGGVNVTQSFVFSSGGGQMDPQQIRRVVKDAAREAVAEARSRNGMR